MVACDYLPRRIWLYISMILAVIGFRRHPCTVHTFSFFCFYSSFLLFQLCSGRARPASPIPVRLKTTNEKGLQTAAMPFFAWPWRPLPIQRHDNRRSVAAKWAWNGPKMGLRGLHQSTSSQARTAKTTAKPRLLVQLCPEAPKRYYVFRGQFSKSSKTPSNSVLHSLSYALKASTSIDPFHVVDSFQCNAF